MRYEDLQAVVSNWGFEVSEVLLRELYSWLDFDRDGTVSFEDLRLTAGKDISPGEQLYFRQDVSKQGKAIICHFPRCFENNQYNNKSHYCELHQKLLKTQALDKLSEIAQSIENPENWLKTMKRIVKANYQMTI